MKAENIHLQRIITLCNNFQKGRSFSEEAFYNDLKTQMRMVELFKKGEVSE